MFNPDLIAYIRAERAAGVLRPDIEKALALEGWSQPDIAGAFGALETMPPTALAQQVPPTNAPVSAPVSLSTPPMTPTPPVQSQPLAAAPTAMEGSHKLRSTLLAASAILLLAAIAGGVFAYYTSMEAPSPTDILKKAIQTSLDTTSLSFIATSTGQVKNTATNGLPSASDYTVTTSGSLSLGSPTEAAFDVRVGGNFTVNTATDTGSMVLGAHLIYVDQDLYFNLNDLKVSYTSSDPKQAQTQMFVALINSIVASLQNKWIVASSSNPQPPATATTSPAFMTKLAAERDYFLGLSYVTKNDNVGTETINGIPSHHLSLTIQFDQQLVELMRQLYLDAEPEAEGTMTFTKQMENLQAAIKKSYSLDLWIGKGDSRIYRVVLAPITFDEAQTGIQSTLSQEVTLSDYNKSLTISAPPEAIPFEQFIQNIFTSVFNGASSAQ